MKTLSRPLVPLLSALAAFACGLLLLTGMPHRALVDEMDRHRVPSDVVYDPLDYTYGVHAPEALPNGTTFSWTDGQATITYPYRANLGRHVHISVRLASWVGGNGSTPITGTLVVNGRPATQFTAGPDFAVVQVELDTQKPPNPYLDPAHVQLGIVSRTASAPGDERALGVAVDWIRLESEQSRTQVLLEAVLWALGLLFPALVATRRFGPRRATILCALTLACMLAVRLSYVPRAITPEVEIGLVGLAWTLAVWLAPRGRATWLWAIPLGLGFTWLVVAGRMLLDWQMDDAYISYRYAWNLVHGQGLVYNPGEVVEGYTNFLWTLLAAGFIGLGLHPTGPMLAVNIAVSLATVALAWNLARRITGSSLWAALAAALLGVDGALAAYGTRGSGMEAALFGLLTLGAISLLWGEVKREGTRRVAAGVLLALASLTRPEGLLVAAVLVAVRAWQDWRGGNRAGRLRPGILTAVAFLTIVVPYQAWRILFYGWLFPNTFYAKTGTTLSLVERGLIYSGYFGSERWLVVALAVVGAALGLFCAIGPRRKREATPGVVTSLSVLLVVYGLYVLWVGGDYFPGWRFFVPVLAPVVLVAVWGLRSLLRPALAGGRIGWAAATIAVGLSAYYLWDATWQQESKSVQAEYTKLHASYVNQWGSAGLWLRESAPPGSSTAAKGAGAIAYYSDRQVIDVYGLNDLHIGHLAVENMGQGNAGHEKKDPAYVLDRRPDFIYAQWANYFEPLAGRLAAEYELFSDRSPTGPIIEWLRRKP